MPPVDRLSRTLPMTALYELVDGETAHCPVLVCGLDNWIDAGTGAAGALTSLVEGTSPTVVARFDADLLVDHQARRPLMHLVDGVNTGLVWPSIELCRLADRAGKPLALLRGAEPDHRWRAFAADVVALARQLGVETVVGLGAYPAAVPHTRPTRVVATATTAELAARVGFLPGQLDVPAGINAAIEVACAQAGIAAVGLWAQVPHYVANFAYPAASAALIDKLAELSGLTLSSHSLHLAAQETRARIDQLVARNPEHNQMVRQLETQLADQLAAEPLPSAEELAAELERFLRDQSDGE